jgi:hypothetical protein
MEAEMSSWRWFAGLAVAAFVIVRASVSPQAVKAAGSALPCSMAFSSPNGVTYGVTSDGVNSNLYQDGLDGVSCQIGGPNSANIKLVLDAKKTTRRIWGFFNYPVSSNNAPESGKWTGNYVTIQQIANMPVGPTPFDTNAHFLFNNWSLNWCGGTINEGGCAGSLPTNAVSVVRSSTTTWIVTAPDCTPSSSCTTLAGDEADLNLNNGTAADYYMPFTITITCLSGC